MIPSTESSFLSFSMEPVELSAAYTYSAVQIAGIRNLIAAAAEEVLRIPLDADDGEVAHGKRRAYLQGQIAILKHLLQQHDAYTQLSQQGN